MCPHVQQPCRFVSTAHSIGFRAIERILTVKPAAMGSFTIIIPRKTSQHQRLTCSHLSYTIKFLLSHPPALFPSRPPSIYSRAQRKDVQWRPHNQVPYAGNEPAADGQLACSTSSCHHSLHGMPWLCPSSAAPSQPAGDTQGDTARPRFHLT